MIIRDGAGKSRVIGTDTHLGHIITTEETTPSTRGICRSNISKHFGHEKS
jgi:hypothetical protein